MAEMAHDKRDARDRAQALINLELRRHARRAKQTAMDHISVLYDEAVNAGKAFDHVAAAESAMLEVERTYFAPALEAGDAPSTP